MKIFIIALIALLGCTKLPNNNPVNEQRQSVQLAKINLGWRLFFDPILSGDEKISCASCHQPNRFMADGLSHALSNSRLNNTPSILNLENKNLFLWDGSAHSLEEQVLKPLINPIEMQGNHIPINGYVQILLTRLHDNPSYRSWFQRAFPGQAGAITIENTSSAIATYERILVSRNNRFDQDILTSNEKEGYRIFKSAGCAECHAGPDLTDDELHILTSASSVKTPSLRNCAATAPYMQGGSSATLEEAILAHGTLGLNNQVLTTFELTYLRLFLESLTDSTWQELATPPAEITSGITSLPLDK